MDFLMVVFPVSGVETNVLVPPLVALVISFFTSMGGVSGAFLILPFQMSALGYTAPSVSGTNFVYNIVAIPSGVYRYIREGRMAWPLTWVVLMGTLPGIFIGYYVRVYYLPDPGTFKAFVGLVLLYLAYRLARDLLRGNPLEAKSMQTLKEGDARVRTTSVKLSRVQYEFQGEVFSFNPVAMFLLAFLVGIVGGAYGIGGGAIIAPICVSVFRLPVYTVAGAALAGTFFTSVVGVIFYSVLPSGLETSPDWLLGLLFGAGGFAGMYLGARAQRFVPQRFIKVMLALVILFVAVKYIVQYF